MIDNTEYIDAYLQGKLSKEEKLQFERLLFDPESSYRDEMELQQDIILAIQERGLRDMLKKQEAAISKKRTRRRIFAWTGGSLASFMAAAAVFMAVVITPMARIMTATSDQYAQSITGMARSGEQTDTLATMFNQACDAIAQDDWQQADSLAQEIMSLSKKTLENYTESERLDYYQNAEWLHVNYLMHTKQTLKARRLLKQIAKRQGNFSQQAENILNQRL